MTDGDPPESDAAKLRRKLKRFIKQGLDLEVEYVVSRLDAYAVEADNPVSLTKLVADDMRDTAGSKLSWRDPVPGSSPRWSLSLKAVRSVVELVLGRKVSASGSNPGAILLDIPSLLLDGCEPDAEPVVFDWFTWAANIADAPSTVVNDATLGDKSPVTFDATLATQALTGVAGSWMQEGRIAAAGRALSFAFLVRGGLPCKADIDLYALHSGNAFRMFAEHSDRLASFIVAHPTVIQALAAWEQEEKSLVNTFVRTASEAIASIFASVGGTLPAAKLATTVGSHVADSAGLATSLFKLAKCRHTESHRSCRVLVLANVVAQTSNDKLLDVLGAVAKHRFQLASAIAPDTLLKIVSADGMTWASVLKCTSPVASPQVQDATSSPPAVEHDQPQAKRQRTRLPLPPARPVAPDMADKANDFWTLRGTKRTHRRHSNIDFSPAPAKKRCVETLPIETFADLREQWPPEDPSALLAAWGQRCSQPMSCEDIQTLKFDPQVEGREGCWAFWRVLSHCGIFVKPYSALTSFVDPVTNHPVNASPGIGSTGQEVVKSVFGTVMWMTTTHRAYVPSQDGELIRRLRVVFPPWNPVHDAKSHSRRGLPTSFAESSNGGGRRGFRN